MLPQWFKDYLTFHRAERNAIIALLILLLLLIGFNTYQRFFWRNDWERMSLEYGPQIVQFAQQTDSIAQAEESQQPWLPETHQLFTFDPNTLDSAGWVALGFSPKQSAAILKYRNAGAVFRKPEDIKKLFVVDEEKYQELEPYIQIAYVPEAKPEYKGYEKPNWQKPEEVKVMIELNTADTVSLLQLKGIGQSYSKRIIKYRDLLGGYISKDQLLEVYGMDSARYLPIIESIKVDTSIRVLLNINTAEAKDLMRHPYIDKNQAKAIINYRQQHGPFKNLQELKKIHLISQEDFSRLAPYCTTQ